MAVPGVATPAAVPGEPLDASPATRLSARLRARTWALHREAERSGVVGAMLRGRVDRGGYALLLRNLLPVYQAMERGLARHRRAPWRRPFADPALARAASIAHDLDAIAGAGASARLPLLPAGARHAARVEAAASGSGIRLLGHAYTRYLGDLSGGQILRKLLARRLGPSMLTLYAFPGIDRPADRVEEIRAALDRLALDRAEAEAVLDEAARAFALAIELSLAVDAAAPAPLGPEPSRVLVG